MDEGDERDRREQVGEEDEASPYQGLGYYTEKDSKWFFGRDRERTRIISNLRTSRLTILYAESGVGKSSLLRAGVVARLRQLADPSIEQRSSARFVPVIFSNWQDEPVERLLAAIESQAAPFTVPARPRAMAVHGTPAAEAEHFGESSGNGDYPTGAPESEMAEAIARAAKATDATVLIILDQFEEHFRYRTGQREPERIADEVAACVNAPGLPVRFLIAVREDAYGGLGDLFRGRVGNVYRNYIHLEYLTRAAAHEAIELPIKRYNEDHEHEQRIELGDGLTDRVLEEVWRGNLALAPRRTESGPIEIPSTPDTDEIEAPFLQLVMERLWRCERKQGSRVLRKETLDDTLGGAGRIVSDHLTDALGALTDEELATAKRLFGELVTPSGAKIAHTAADLVKITKAPEESVASVLHKLDEQRIVRAVDPARGATEPRYEIFHDKLAAAILDWLGQLEAEQLRLDKEKAEADKAKAEEETRVKTAQAHRLRLLTICLGVLILGLGALAIFAFHQKSKADTEKTAAVKETAKAVMATDRAAYFGLTSSAASELSTRPDVALLLFLAAYEKSPQALAERSLVATFQDVRMSGATGILHGQTDAIEGVAFSRPTSTLASASGDGTIRLWHVDQNGHYPLGRPLKAGGPVLSVAFSPDGHSLASGSFDKVIVWNLRTGQQRVEHPGGAVTSVAYSRTGQWLAAASLGGTVFLWNLATGQTEVLPSNPLKQVRSVAFSPTDDSLLAAGQSGGKVVLWNVATGREIGALNGHKTDVYAVAFSPDGQRLAAGGSGNKIVVWNLADKNKVQATLTAQSGFIYSLAFDPHGDALAAGGMSDVEVWNPVTDTSPTTSLTGQEGAVYGVAFSPDGHVLVSAGADRTIHVWSYPVGHTYGVPLPQSHRRPVLSVAVSPTGLIAAGSYEGTIVVLDRTTAKALTIKAPKLLHAVVFLDGGRILASAGNDGAISLWDPTTGQPLGKLKPIGRRVQILSLASDPGGSTLVSGDALGNVRVWNVNSRSEIGDPLSGDISGVFAVALNPRTRYIAAGGNGRTIRVWEPRDGGWVRWRSYGQGDALFALAFSPDGQKLASGGGDGSVRVWNVNAPPTAPPKALLGDTAFVRGLAFSPDGKTLASAGGDDKIRLWDVATDTELGDPLTGDTAQVESVAFSPDGQFLVSGADDRTVRLWQAPALPKSFADFRNEVCTFLGAGLNAPEWSTYAPGIPFQQTCPRVTPG